MPGAGSFMTRTLRRLRRAERARRAARLASGGVERAKEARGDRRGFPLVETLLRDFRYGLASLRRSPGFAIAAVGILALGIGANTAMFSVVDAVLLKPLPYPEPGRLVSVGESSVWFGASALNFVDWKRLNTSFEALSAESPAAAAVMIGSEPERWRGYTATADYFRVYGVHALLGRTFGPGEDQPGAPGVVVLSYSTWQARFGGAADLLNRDLVIDGERHRIIGVLRPGSYDRDGTMFCRPLVFTPAQLTRESMWLSVTGRLRPGITLEQAQEDMRGVSAALDGLNPIWKKGWRAAVAPFGQYLVAGRLRRTLYVAFGAVAMVLLIACSNMGNLLLARGASRRKEMAVRAALGAGRGRLVTQLFAESLALCVLGGAAGVALAHGLVRVAHPLLVRSLPATAEVTVDLRVLAFAAATVLGISLLVGFLPALQTSSGTLYASLNQGTRGSSGSRAVLRRAIVIGEVAVSLVLICGALLMFRTLLNLENADSGVHIEHVITTSIELPAPAHPHAESVVQFTRALVERLRAVPSVDRAAVATSAPLDGLRERGVLVAPGLVDGASVTIGIKHIGEHYLATLGIPVLSGRGFNDRDGRGSPHVALVNQELAARLAVPDPVGRVVGVSLSPYGTTRAELVQVQIVGVIRTERTGNLHQAQEPVAYVPMAQEPVRFMTLIVRTRRDPSSVVPAVRQAVRELDRGLPIGPVVAMRELKARSFTDTTQSAWAIGMFAAVAALLAAFGLYSVLAQAVTEQRREFGIRMALGAAPGAIVAGVLASALPMIAAGVAAGLGGAFALSGVLKSLLFHVSALDPLAFVVACASMMLVGLLAVFVPAARAAAVDPVTTLREEG
jgi:putative ABC transport system permease protein